MRPTTEAGRRLVADLWGVEPEGEIAHTAAQEQWWNAAILAIEEEARSAKQHEIEQLRSSLWEVLNLSAGPFEMTPVEQAAISVDLLRRCCSIARDALDDKPKTMSIHPRLQHSLDTMHAQPRKECEKPK
jgi:hypothetical protein